MTVVSVWAPRARSVALVIGGRALEMQALPGGWWQVETALAEHGVDYAFSLDGGAPLPDPRSPWQPYGVQAFSRFFDHARFVWHDEGWRQPPLGAAILYELHVGTFTPEGSFDGVVRKLDYLKDLGVSHIELMPVNSFSGGRGWGYDGVALYAPQEAYGGPEGLKRLVEACHLAGIGVILDVVYNHFGPEGSHLEAFGPYLSELHPVPWGKAVNFDGPDSDAVRAFFLGNARMWFEDYHVDGLRLDAVHAILDTSALHILEELAREAALLENTMGRQLCLIAESALNDPRLVRSPEAGGYGLDAQWSDDLHHALHTLLTGEQDGYYVDFGSLGDLAKALTSGFIYDGRYSRYRRRRHGRPFASFPGHRLLAYSQNHDQVGNRARGERLSRIVGIGRLKIAAALVLTSPFTPLIFQGEEWGASTPFQYFTDHQDKDLARAVREGRRKEFAAFGWEPEDVPDPQDFATFERSRLDWGEISKTPHDELLAWHRSLIALRRSEPDLRAGARPGVSFSEEEGWLSVRRGNVLVLCNLGAAARRIPLPSGAPRYVLLASCSSDVQLSVADATLMPETVVVLKIFNETAAGSATDRCRTPWRR
ncbi:Malto-oligosyltrehalose trehalohydrolase [uncultured Desulfatiglans sp.]|uniref:Malto-oligosyltrehalose trehalohydrolase n=1 Tax=Uncultured Desulfatiglans sp. TaxID=1748965 RepID=A0A653A949_UNCDX|nr:Malto-oligosyltrehalose trehalohydrolase [uncultured Desulfatiglans sp.]